MSRPLPIIHGITEHDAGPYRMERLDLEFSNGERRLYERLHGRGYGAVAVVPMLDADTVLLVREYAAGVHRYEPEALEVVPWKLAELGQLILREEFSEGRSIAALFLVREWLEQQPHG